MYSVQYHFTKVVVCTKHTETSFTNQKVGYACHLEVKVPGGFFFSFILKGITFKKKKNMWTNIKRVQASLTNKHFSIAA